MLDFFDFWLLALDFGLPDNNPLLLAQASV